MSPNRSTNINFCEISSDENAPSVINSVEDIGPKFVFSLKVGKLVIKMTKQEEEEQSQGVWDEEKVTQGCNTPVAVNLECTVTWGEFATAHTAEPHPQVSDSEGLW